MNELLKNQKVIETKAILSILITLGFALYNGFIGLRDGALWNISIAFYYFFIFLIKMILVIFDRLLDYDNRETRKKYTSFLLPSFFDQSCIDSSWFSSRDKQKECSSRSIDLHHYGNIFFLQHYGFDNKSKKNKFESIKKTIETCFVYQCHCLHDGTRKYSHQCQWLLQQ